MNKTPVQLLNENCAKQGMAAPQYTFEKKQDVPCTIFQATCILALHGRNYVAIGIGQKKKDAQHNAAKAMFCDQLRIPHEDHRAFEQLINNNVTGLGSKNTTADVNQRDVYVEDMDYPDAGRGNPIADLEDFCRKYQLPEPEYDMNAENIGPSHCPVLSVTCTVGRLMISGKSKTKKLAKRISAVKIVQELKKRRSSSAPGTNQFGDEVQQLAQPTPSEERGIINQHLELLDDDKNNVNLKRSKKKTYDDFFDANINKRNDEFIQKLKNHPGKHFQQLLTFGREIDANHPFVADPCKLYEDWIRNTYENRIMDYFQLLKKELNFEEAWSEIENRQDPTQDRYMIVLHISIPGIEVQPTAIRQGSTKGTVKELAVIDVISNVATLTVRRADIKRKS